MKVLIILGLVTATIAYSSRQFGPRPGGPGGPPPPGGPGGPRPGGPGGPPPFGGPGGPPPFGGPGGPPPFGGPGGPPPFGGPGGLPPFGGPGGPHGGPGRCPPNNLNANKDLVRRATQELFGDYSVANIESFMHADFLEHNPLVADGRDSLKNFILSLKDEPKVKVKVDIKRIIADEDYVWVHSSLPLLGKVYAAVDIYRFECGKIAEHWDALQDTQLSAPAANPHPFF